MRTSEQEDKADALQVTVKHGHMLVSEAAVQAAFTLSLALLCSGSMAWSCS